MISLLEPEARFGTHVAGRSAVLFAERFGNATIRALTRTSRELLAAPPEGFCERPILKRS
jgi:D-arginine dehydrogenase